MFVFAVAGWKFNPERMALERISTEKSTDLFAGFSSCSRPAPYALHPALFLMNPLRCSQDIEV
jgi:hypothetical protein